MNLEMNFIPQNDLELGTWGSVERTIAKFVHLFLCICCSLKAFRGCLNLEKWRSWSTRAMHAVNCISFSLKGQMVKNCNWGC